MRQLFICLFTLLIGLPAIGHCQDGELYCPYLAKNGQYGKACCQDAKSCPCQDSKECCAEAIAGLTGTTVAQVVSTACQAKATACQAKATACKCKATAGQVASTACQAKATACQAKATACKCKATAGQVASTACQANATACQTNATACQTKASASLFASATCPVESAVCQKDQTACTGCPSDDRITHLQKAAKHLHAAGLVLEAKHVLAAAQALRHNLLERKVAELNKLQAEVHALQRATGQLPTKTTR